jgi:hypothetical protein
MLRSNLQGMDIIIPDYCADSAYNPIINLHADTCEVTRTEVTSSYDPRQGREDKHEHSREYKHG